MSEITEILFQKNERRIEDLKKKVDRKNKMEAAPFAYSFVQSTLSEATASSPSSFTVRFLTDARKSGEGAGLGTGLPAFYDSSSSSWLDFSGNAIVV